MLAIALDTSTLRGSLGWAVFESDETHTEVVDFAEMSAPAKPGHAETLLPRIDQMLKMGGFSAKDVDLVVFTQGPGTFTGLRIGLSTVKGLALSNGASVVGMSSLESLALCSEKTGYIGTLIDARRKELFGALYEVSHDRSGCPTARSVVSDRVGGASEIARQFKEAVPDGPVQLVGNGAAAYREMFVDELGEQGVFLPERLASPSAYWMLRLGYARFRMNGGDNLATLEPIYLREPDAKLPGEKKI